MKNADFWWKVLVVVLFATFCFFVFWAFDGRMLPMPYPHMYYHPMVW